MKKKILVIEDDESMREILTILLQEEGYEVETARDGQEAILILGKQWFDLVITDFNMPEINGIGVIKFIRKRDSNIKIILISGEDMKLMYPAAKNAGADKVIPKNFDLKLSYISKAVKELLA